MLNRTLMAGGLLALVGGALPAAGSPLSQSALDELGLVKYWEASIPLGEEDSLESGHLVDGTLYVVSSRGSVYSVLADVGLIRWGMNLTKKDYVVRRPFHLINGQRTGPVAIRATDQLFILDRYDGSVLHSSQPDMPFGSGFAGAGDLLFSGSSDGRFYANRWTTRNRDQLYPVWHVQTDGPITADPILYGGNKVVFATQGGTVYSCVAFDKTLVWRFRTGGAVLANPAVSVNGVFIASQDQSLYMLDGETGRLVWRYRTPGMLSESPVVAGDTVYQYGEVHGLAAVDASSGKARWVLPQGRSLAARMADRDIIRTQTGSLQAVDHESGSVLTEVRGAGVVDVAVNARHDSIYVLSSEGAVLCARPAGAPHLRPSDVEVARRTMNRPPPARQKSSEEKAVSNSTARDSDPFRSSRDR